MPIHQQPVSLPSAGWRWLAESVAGAAHGDTIPCQDACLARTVQIGRSQVWLAACADGAGSARASDVGARLACRVVLDSVERLWRARSATRPPRRLPQRALKLAFREARLALVAAAEQLALDPRELATTLLVAVAGPTWSVFAQVGDGVIVIDSAAGYRHVFWPDRGEYVNTTSFLTDETARLQVAHGPRVDALALLTDGLQDLALDQQARAPHAPFFRGVLAEVGREAQPLPELAEHLRRFLGSSAVRARTDDDVSLVLAVRTMTGQHRAAR